MCASSAEQKAPNRSGEEDLARQVCPPLELNRVREEAETACVGQDVPPIQSVQRPIRGFAVLQDLR